MNLSRPSLTQLQISPEEIEMSTRTLEETRRRHRQLRETVDQRASMVQEPEDRRLFAKAKEFVAPARSGVLRVYSTIDEKRVINKFKLRTEAIEKNRKKTINNSDSFERVVSAVSAELGVEIKDILSSAQVAQNVTARQMSFLILSEISTHSLSGIARAFEKDHSTLLHGIKVMKAKIQANRALGVAYWAIKSKLEASVAP